MRVRSGGRGFDPRQVRQHSIMEIDQISYSHRSLPSADLRRAADPEIIFTHTHGKNPKNYAKNRFKIGASHKRKNLLPAAPMVMKRSILFN